MASARRKKKQATAEEQSQVLTAKEAMSLLRLSHATMYRRIADGTIKAERIGRVWRIPRSEIDRLTTTG